MEQLNLFDYPSYEINKKIRLIELFAGMGTQAQALNRLGVDFEHHFVCEFDKYAIQVYNAIHGTNFETSDVTKIHAKDLDISDKDKYTYLLTYSFPCFIGDTLVLTDNGYKEIKDVVVGDYVLTHDNSFQKVVNSKKTKENAAIISINVAGTDGISCTPDHRFLVRTMKIKQSKKNGVRKQYRVLSEPKWKAAKDIKRWDFLGFPCNQDEIFPEWNGYKYRLGHGEKNIIANELSEKMNNPNFWWLVGRYLADGWFLKDSAVVFSIRTSKLPEFENIVKSLGFNYSIKEKERAAQKVYICKKELLLFLSEFGSGAYNKQIPGYVFKMPICLIENIIKGYESGDGWVEKKRNRHIASSVSRKLIYGMSYLIRKTFNRPVQISKNYRNYEVCINGKLSHINGYLYTLTYKKQSYKGCQAIVLDNQIWQPVKKVIDNNEKADVYDITVEKNHTFTANGVIVHNCQDLSLAGKQRGMQENSGTRSSLLFEVKRLLNECTELPDVLLMENVPQVHSEKNKEDFDKWLDFLKSKGYFNFWQDINAKNYGIPQNRDRCFCVSILSKDFVDYQFPKEVKLPFVMKDYLEPTVEEKYYTNSPKAKELIEKLVVEKKLPSEKTVGYMNYNKVEETNVFATKTLCARDYKGFGTGWDTMNGVIEPSEIRGGQKQF